MGQAVLRAPNAAITLALCRAPVANGLFARANEDSANAVVQEAHAPVSSADLDRVIARISSDFAKQFGRALMVPIEKVRAFADLPQAIRDSAAAQSIQAMAAHVADDHADDARKIIFHVSLGLLTVINICLIDFKHYEYEHSLLIAINEKGYTVKIIIAILLLTLSAECQRA